MPKRSLLPLGIVGPLLIVILNAFFGVWRHHLPYSRKLRSIESASNPNLLLLGNSLLDDRLDETLFRYRCIRARQILPASEYSFGRHWSSGAEIVLRVCTV